MILKYLLSPKAKIIVLIFHLFLVKWTVFGGVEPLLLRAIHVFLKVTIFFSLELKKVLSGYKT